MAAATATTTAIRTAGKERSKPCSERVRGPAAVVAEDGDGEQADQPGDSGRHGDVAQCRPPPSEGGEQDEGDHQTRRMSPTRGW